MQVPFRSFPLAMAAVTLVAACAEPLDFDLRGNLGGFSTAEAAQSVTADRPEPDARGVISYPNYQVAVAQGGDTVETISSRLGLSAAEVARFNGLRTTDPLRAGEVVALPNRVAGGAPVNIEALAGAAIDAAPTTTPNANPVTVTELEPAREATPEPAPPTGPEPVRHKVKRGETAYTIARLYDVPVRSLSEWNGLGPDFAIREDQVLLIPVTSTSRAAPVETAATTTAPGSGSPTPTPPSATEPLPEETIPSAAETEAAKEAQTASVGAPSQATRSAQMAFPVQGKIIRAYSKGRNDGIDIAGTPGDPVTAAADGTVAAITADADQVPIIVVRHPDNLLTVYANVDEIDVSKGDRVKRGSKLGTLRSGDDAYVHFEIRNGFDSVDPMPYLE